MQENLRGFAIGDTRFAEFEPILRPISSRVNGWTDRQISLLVHLHDLGGDYAAGPRHCRVADLLIEELSERQWIASIWQLAADPQLNGSPTSYSKTPETGEHTPIEQRSS